MQLVVNDYWQLALEEGCDFVHLGQGDLAGADLAALRRAGVRLGVSTHDHAELERALALHPDYVALGPIYPTLLKVMPWAPQGLARLSEWKRRIGALPLVAIGGLTPSAWRGCSPPVPTSPPWSPTSCATRSRKHARANGSRRRRPEAAGDDRALRQTDRAARGRRGGPGAARRRPRCSWWAPAGSAARCCRILRRPGWGSW